MFTAASVTRAKIQKQCKCLSSDKWMHTMGHLHGLEYYSASKRKKTPQRAPTWMSLWTYAQ